MKSLLTALSLAAASFACAGDQPMPFSAVATELLGALESAGILGKYPQEKLDAFRDRLIGLSASLAEFNTPIELIPEGRPLPQPKVALANGTRTAVISASSLEGNIQDAFKQIDAMPQASTPSAIVLDLRGAGGNDPKAVEKLLELLGARGLPAAALCDSGTHALAESALASLRDRKCLLMGAPSSGCPGQFRQVKLMDNSMLLLPDKKADPIAPDIDLSQYDKALWPRIAADIVTSISVMKPSGGQ